MSPFSLESASFLKKSERVQFGPHEGVFSRDGQFYFCTCLNSAGDGQVPVDLRSALIHTRDPKAALFSVARDLRFHSFAVIVNAQHQLIAVNEFHLQRGGARMEAGVADGLIADPVNLIADNRMNLAIGTFQIKNKFNGTATLAFLARPPEVLGQSAAFEIGHSEGSERRAAFICRPREPVIQALHVFAELLRIGGLAQCEFG